jgi:hypothetical protein
VSATRYALVAGNREMIANYLPDNYRVREVVDDIFDSPAHPVAGVVVEGEDHAGWTLDGYVLPRLASGLYAGREIFRGDDGALVLSR